MQSRDKKICKKTGSIFELIFSSAAVYYSLVVYNRCVSIQIFRWKEPFYEIVLHDIDRIDSDLLFNSVCQRDFRPAELPDLCAGTACRN